LDYWIIGLLDYGQRTTDYNPLYTKCTLRFHAPTEHFILAQGYQPWVYW